MAKSTLKGAIKPEHLKKYKENFLANEGLKVAMNAVTRGNLQDIALNRDVLNRNNWTFSHEIEEKPDISDQKQSGTCWMFADLNWLRTITMKKFKIEKLEFSQNHLMFYDKLEKANYYLEILKGLTDRDIDDRHVRFILDNPTPDGGEWHMIVNLINKYGLIPKDVMPDSFNREQSRFINQLVGYKIREAFGRMRSVGKSKKRDDALETCKADAMTAIYRILATCMGIPPKKFDWSYRDKDKNYHQEIGITPQEFKTKYLEIDLGSCFTLASCPAENTAFGKTFTIDLFGNMVGGDYWKWLNVPVKELKKIAIKMLKDGNAVLYGCDVVQDSHSKEGLLITDLYDYDLLFQTPFGMVKKNRLDYGQSRLTHSMVLIGVELVGKKPIRWKVENSWGTEVGKKGFFVMSDEWFDEHVLDLIVPPEYMPEELKKQFEQKPIVLPPWHVMA
ncbi:C1 family peptidase [bacterium]|nr:C1 family peptidase [candidate division CSSED10-310 bacterium]